jgi:ABC-type multidrug transport system fused ATPase/permease subunit
LQAHSISRRLLAAYLRQPYEFFLDHHSGDMAKEILVEANQVVQLMFRPAFELIAAILTVLAIVGLLLWIDPKMAVLAFLLVGFIYAVSYGAGGAFIKRAGHRRAGANAQRFRIANEALTGIKDIKLIGRERNYVERFTLSSLVMARAQMAESVITQLPQYVVQAFTFSGIILFCMLLIEPASVDRGESLREMVPTLGVFAFAGQRLMPEFSKVYQMMTRVQYGAAALEGVSRDLKRAEATSPLPIHPPTAMGLKQEISLSSVSYRYPNAATAGLDNVELSIRRGEKVGIVGSTGAGKTTLVDIILGLLTPQHGALVVDATPITLVNQRAWQQSVGYVPQDIFLSDATLTENIALGVPPEEVDQARVERSAIMAQLHEFISNELPQGYATEIGERGIRLSGGQRQRVGIARALYHDADLIVFDEATSALDTLTEREVITSIEALPGDKTILMIAHRLSTVRICDRIIVLDSGRVVGSGSWDELSAGNPYFQRLSHGAGFERRSSD